MRTLAEQKYALTMAEAHLPSQTLEQVRHRQQHQFCCQLLVLIGCTDPRTDQSQFSIQFPSLHLIDQFNQFNHQFNQWGGEYLFE